LPIESFWFYLRTEPNNMIRNILSLTAFALLFSCSGDDDAVTIPTETINTNGTKVVRIVSDFDDETAPDSFRAVHRFFYNGNKLSSIQISTFPPEEGSLFYYSDRYSYRFIYNGNLISKIRIYNKSNSAVHETIFEYNDQGQVVSKTDSSHNKWVYTHQADGSLTSQHYTIQADGSLFLLNDAEIFRYTSGQLSQWTLTGSYQPNTKVEDFTCDNKHNPLLAITGYDKIINYYNPEGGHFKQANNHNITEVLMNYTFGTNLTTGSYGYEYTYNSFDYPITCELTGYGTMVARKTFFYQ
jgi:YD repeat-containing protein